MQRRDPRMFLEEVMAKVPDLSEATKRELLDIVNEKAGTKRAAHLAQILASDNGTADGARVAARVVDADPDAHVPPPPPRASVMEEEREDDAPVAAAPPPPPPPAAKAPKKTRARKPKASAAAAPEGGPKVLNPFAGEISDEDVS